MKISKIPLNLSVVYIFSCNTHMVSACYTEGKKDCGKGDVCLLQAGCLPEVESRVTSTLC